MHEIFVGICPPEGIVGPDRLRNMAPGYCATSRDAQLLLRPDRSDIVAAICARASQHGIGIVTQRV